MSEPIEQMSVNDAIRAIAKEKDRRTFRSTPTARNPLGLSSCWGVESKTINLRVRCVCIYTLDDAGQLAACSIEPTIETTAAPTSMTLRMSE